MAAGVAVHEHIPGVVPESASKSDSFSLLSPTSRCDSQRALQQLRSPVALASSLRRLRTAVAELTPSPSTSKRLNGPTVLLSPKHKPKPSSTNGSVFMEGFMLKLKSKTQYEALHKPLDQKRTTFPPGGFLTQTSSTSDTLCSRVHYSYTIDRRVTPRPLVGELLLTSRKGKPVRPRAVVQASSSANQKCGAHHN